MKTFPAIYKGNRLVELTEDIDLSKNEEVFVLIPEQDDEKKMQDQLRSSSENVFAKLWGNREDEVWNEYL